MGIYQQKKYWKIGLSVFAALLFSISWWYTNSLVKKISSEERNRVKAWAKGIEVKAQLVNHTDHLFEKISDEERKKGELWAKGVKKLISTNDPHTDYDFLFEVIRNNETVPVILTNERGKITNYRNLDFEEDKPSEAFLQEQLALMQQHSRPIVIQLPHGGKNYLYYKDSKIFSELKSILDEMNHSLMSEVVLNSASVPVILTDSSQEKIIDFGFIDLQEAKQQKISKEEYLTQLLHSLKEKANPKPLRIEIRPGQIHYVFYKDSLIVELLKYFPFFQTFLIGTFILIAYFLFSTSRKAEQDQVWVGMSKETAHQLGTPISSMMAWLELLKDKYLKEEILLEFDKDVLRLETVADRFSKIGSQAKLETVLLVPFITETLDYLKTRLSKQVAFHFNYTNEQITAEINKPLFSWVLENLTKNAVDAMSGKGTLNISLLQEHKKLILDISDTGKGMTKNQVASAFQPGFTTKKRGWGLGLALVKRIIENYLNGKVYIKESIVNQGTTFRIILPA